jgi:DNA-binding PadR family transcriptional regulator
MKLLSRNEEYLLLAVLRLGDEAYSTPIRGLLYEITGRKWSYGSIFVSLEKLEEKDYLTSTMSDPEPVQGGRSKRIYSITARGETALSSAADMHAAMWKGVKNLLSSS